MYYICFNRLLLQCFKEICSKMSDRFYLKWNNFKDNIVKSFTYLREEKNLFDVTLVSNDHKHLSAHKLVLTASSEYFREIFKKSNFSQFQLMLCLEGVNSQELNNVLEYIYNGEIKIYQHELERFMEIAERYKLQGLIGADEDQVEDKNFEKVVPRNQFMGNQNLNVTLKESLSDIPPKSTSYYFISSEANIKEEDFKTDQEKVKDYDANSFSRIHNDISPIIGSVLISNTFNSIEELNQRIDEEMFKEDDGTWRCRMCPKVSKNKSHIKEHVEVHFDLTFPCQLCEKTFRSRATSRVHRRQCLQLNQTLSSL